MWDRVTEFFYRSKRNIRFENPNSEHGTLQSKTERDCKNKRDRQ